MEAALFAPVYCHLGVQQWRKFSFKVKFTASWIGCVNGPVIKKLGSLLLEQGWAKVFDWWAAMEYEI